MPIKTTQVLSKFFDAAVRSFDEKLPPYASVHTVAQVILHENLENEVFVEDDERVEIPKIALILSEEVDKDKFFRSLEKTIQWHEYVLEWMNVEKTVFIVSNGLVEHKIYVYDRPQRKAVVNSLRHRMEVI